MTIINSTLIPDVELRQIQSHKDERGYFREVIKVSDGFFKERFAQWSHSYKYPGYYTEQFHIHKHQVDWWYIVVGQMTAVLFDTRDSADGKFHQFVLSQDKPTVLRIPPGVAHGFKVSDNSVHMMYITSQEYNPDDEGRIDLEFDWSTITI